MRRGSRGRRARTGVAGGEEDEDEDAIWFRRDEDRWLRTGEGEEWCESSSEMSNSPSYTPVTHCRADIAASPGLVPGPQDA